MLNNLIDASKLVFFVKSRFTLLAGSPTIAAK